MIVLRFAIALFAGLLCAATVDAQGSGLLLGLSVSSSQQESDIQDFASIHEPKSQTLWIARDGTGAAKILATVPELIVPRRDGFWHVGVTQVCEFEDANESLRQVIWAAPVSQPGRVEQSAPCIPHKPEDYAPPFGRSEADKDKISQCGFNLMDIVFLSPELISSSAYSGQSEDCEPRGGRYSLGYEVRKFDPAGPLAMIDLLGPGARAAFLRALPRQATDDSGQDCGEPSRDDDKGWRIAHVRGRWRPYLHQQMGNFGCSTDALVRISIPDSLTGDASVPFDWTSLQAKLGGASDAYVSPRGDLLIAVSKYGAALWEARGGVPVSQILALPAGTIVMAQWSAGTHVNDWTEQLTRFAAKPLPAPVIHVKSTSPGA